MLSTVVMYRRTIYYMIFTLPALIISLENKIKNQLKALEIILDCIFLKHKHLSFLRILVVQRLERSMGLEILENFRLQG